MCAALPQDVHRCTSGPAAQSQEQGSRVCGRNFHHTLRSRPTTKPTERFGRYSRHRWGIVIVTLSANFAKEMVKADCDVCAQSKLTKQPHNTRGLKARERAKGINFIIHTDSMTRTVGGEELVSPRIEDVMTLFVILRQTQIYTRSCRRIQFALILPLVLVLVYKTFAPKNSEAMPIVWWVPVVHLLSLIHI